MPTLLQPTTTIRRPFRARTSAGRPTKLAKTLVAVRVAGARIFEVATPEALAKADLQSDPTSQAATVQERRSLSTSTTMINGSKDRLQLQVAGQWARDSGPPQTR